MHIGPVIAVGALDRARALYEGQLGLTGRETPDDLRVRRVPFLGPGDLPFALDEDQVSVDQSGMQVAWMRDPDGNVLTVFSLDDGDDGSED